MGTVNSFPSSQEGSNLAELALVEDLDAGFERFFEDYMVLCPVMNAALSHFEISLTVWILHTIGLIFIYTIFSWVHNEF